MNTYIHTHNNHPNRQKQENEKQNGQQYVEQKKLEQEIQDKYSLGLRSKYTFAPTHSISCTHSLTIHKEKHAHTAGMHKRDISTFAPTQRCEIKRKITPNCEEKGPAFMAENPHQPHTCFCRLSDKDDRNCINRSSFATKASCFSIMCEKELFIFCTIRSFTRSAVEGGKQDQRCHH